MIYYIILINLYKQFEIKYFLTFIFYLDKNFISL